MGAGLGLQGIFREFGPPWPTSKTAPSPQKRRVPQNHSSFQTGPEQGIFRRHAGTYRLVAGIEQVNRSPVARASCPAYSVKVNPGGFGADPARGLLDGSLRAKSENYFVA